MASKGTGITYAVVKRGGANSGKVIKSGVRAGVSPTSTNPKDVRARESAARARANRSAGTTQVYRSKNGAVDIKLNRGATKALQNLAPSGKHEAPQNVGQWFMNLLSTGAYAVGEAGYRSNAMTDQATRQLGRGEVGEGLQSLGDAGGRFLRGFGVGVAEGLGYRPEGRKPITPSQVLNGKIDTSGVADEETLREQRRIIDEGGFNGQVLSGADDSRALDNGSSGAAAEVTKRGLLNFGEDVLLDPASYLTFGVGGAAKGAVKGAGAAARAAAEAAEAAGTTASRGSRFLAGVGGAAKGAVRGGAREFGEQFTGPAQNLANVGVRRAARRDARAALRPQAAAGAPEPVNVLDDVAAPAVAREMPAEALPVAAAREVEAPAAREVPAAAEIETPNAVTAQVADDIARANRLSIAKERDAAVRGAVEEINGPLGRITIDAPRILDDSREVTSTGTLTRDHVEALQELASGPIAGLEKRISAVGKMDAVLGKVLKQPTDVIIDGKPITVARLVERIATKRATGGGSPVQQAALRNDMAALAKVLRAQSGTSRITPNSLQGALERAGVALPENIGIQELYRRLGAEKTPAARQQVLKDVLEQETGQRFDSVEAALQAAVGGELSFPEMRKIAKALGIATAKTRDDLQQILNDRALPAWDEIRQAIDTPDDVAAAHGISPDSLAKAAEADLPAAQQAGADALDAARQSPLDELIERPGRSATREMLEMGVQSLGRALVRQNGEMIPGATEAFGNGRWLDQWRQITRMFSRTTGARLGEKPLERSVAADQQIMVAMEALEDYARSIGVFPRISDEAGVDAFGGPLFASVGQLLRELPDETRRAAMFPEGISMENVGKGITLYPTTFANGVRRAVFAAEQGTPIEDIASDFRQFIERQARLDAGRRGVKPQNAWIGGEQGQRALDDLAAAIADGDYLTRVRQIHAATEPLAVRAASDAAGEATRPALAGLLEVISRGGPDMQREVLDVVNQARADADALRQATNGTDNLVSDLAHQRLTQGLIDGILGADGVRALRAEQRLVKGQEDPAVTKAAIAAAERGKKRRQPTAERAAELQKASDDAARAMDDEQPVVDEAVEEVNGYREDTDVLADIESNAVAWSQMDALRVAFDAVGQQVSGSFGMGQRLKAVVMEGENVSNTAAAQFTQRMRGLARAWGKGLQAELHLNRPADYDTVTATARTWIATLSRMPDEIGPAQRVGWLVDQGLSQAQAQMASTLKDQIDHVFGTGLVRSRVQSDDLYQRMSQYGGVASMPDPKQPLRDQATIWKQWSDPAVDPLDTLNRWSHAIKMAQVAPGVAHAAEKLFGHKAFGMSASEAKAAGWVRLNTTGPRADFARYFGADTYFPPEAVTKLRYVQNFFTASSKFSGKNTRMMVGAYDAVLRVLKSAATVWRPGHHVTNILGEIGINLMDGVSPLNTVRALKSMRAGGSLLDADWDILNRADFGGPVDPKYLTGDVIVNVGGRGQSVSLQDLYARAIASGVAQTHTTARDIADPLVEQLHPGRLAKTREVLGRPDELLGRFSAARDNVTRMAHFISVLERGQYRSLDDAFNAAATRVHDFHPSFLTLSMGERKYARRIFYFYTWQRQAISLILRTAINRPGLVSMPSKLQYGFAQANGLDPESIGQVQNGDERLPSYYRDTLLGPQWAGGNTVGSSPEQIEEQILARAGLDKIGVTSVDSAIRLAKQNQIPLSYQNALLKALGDSQGPYKRQSTIQAHLDDQAGKYWAANRNGHLWGLSLSQPQIDTLQSLFSGATLDNDKGPLEGTGRELIIGNLAPTLRAPLEIAAQRQLTGNMSDLENSGGTSAYLFNQLGAPSQLSKLLPSGNTEGTSGGSVYQEYFPRNSDKYTTPESNANERNRALLNFLLGMKFTDYTSDSAQAVRRVEDRDAAMGK